MEESGGESKHSSLKWMTAVLLVLLMLIVGLVVGIVFVWHGGSDSDLEDSDSSSGAGAALVLNQEILTKFGEDADYDLDQAFGDFEEAIENSNDSEKAYLLLYYADFAYMQTGEVNYAIKILEKEETNLPDEGKINYYIVLADYYDRAGNAERAAECRQIINDLMPVDTRSMEEMMEEDDE